jgi:hypothetical protein
MALEVLLKDCRFQAFIGADGASSSLSCVRFVQRLVLVVDHLAVT